MDKVIKRDDFREVRNPCFAHTVNYTTNNCASELLKVHQKLILLFSKDALNRSEVTVKTLTLLPKISISNKCFSFEFYIHQIILKMFPHHSIDNNKCFLSTNQHIRMISEGSCDTGDWSNDAENSALPSQE